MTALKPSGSSSRSLSSEKSVESGRGGRSSALGEGGGAMLRRVTCPLVLNDSLVAALAVSGGGGSAAALPASGEGPSDLRSGLEPAAAMAAAVAAGLLGDPVREIGAIDSDMERPGGDMMPAASSSGDDTLGERLSERVRRRNFGVGGRSGEYLTVPFCVS